MHQKSIQQGSPFTSVDYQAAANIIRARTQHQPTVGLILGSGLSGVADAITDATRINYSEIPNWPHTKVVGHKNSLVIGHLDNQIVMALQGRAHLYEGYSPYEITFPVRVMRALGVQTLIVTNAAGGVNKQFAAGDVMMINDHLNLPGLVGLSPLFGPNDDSLGTRFPDMSTAYDPHLRQLARQVATQLGITLREGVYAFLTGPTFESPAEIRMLRSWGADAVGMSTVPEVVAARHAGHDGMRVLGFSGITNATIDVLPEMAAPQHETSHLEVLDMGAKIIAPKMIALIRGVLSSI